MKNRLTYNWIKPLIIKYPNGIFYFLAVLTLVFQMAILRLDIILKFDPHSSFITYTIRSLIDGLLLLLPFWILPAKFRRSIWIVIFLFTIWALSQLWYYRTYNDLMPFCSYILFENVSPLLANSIIGSMHYIDLLIVIPIFLLYGIYYRYFRIPIQKTKLTSRIRIYYVSGILLFSALIYIANAISYHYKDGREEVMSIWGKYISTTSYASYWEMNGFVALGIHSIVETILEKQKLTDSERNEINAYIRNNTKEYTKKPFTIEKKKNLILVVVESLNSWVINSKIDGIEITPFLNKFCREDSSIVALKILPQVKDGRSSDAHFIFNTGLLPIKNGAVSTRFGTRDYPSLAKALKDYNSLEIICDDSAFWNQKNTYHSYGFHRLYDCNTMPKPKEGEIIDQIMLKKAIDILKKEPQPFYAQLVTIAMHKPYDKLLVPSTAISHSQKYTQEVRNYLEVTHAFDQAIGEFVDNLKKIGLYENSTIAIISDHDELDKNVIEGREETLLSDRETTMIILNAPQALHYKEVMGQIDIYPTLLDIMGIKDYYWKGLGHSIFSNTPPSSAVLWSGKVAGNKKSKTIPMQIKAWEISNLMISKHYFNTK